MYEFIWVFLPRTKILKFRNRIIHPLLHSGFGAGRAQGARTFVQRAPRDFVLGQVADVGRTIQVDVDHLGLGLKVSLCSQVDGPNRHRDLDVAAAPRWRDGELGQAAQDGTAVVAAVGVGLVDVQLDGDVVVVVRAEGPAFVPRQAVGRLRSPNDTRLPLAVSTSGLLIDADEAAAADQLAINCQRR